MLQMVRSNRLTSNPRALRVREGLRALLFANNGAAAKAESAAKARAAQKGIVHKNAASRKISRLTKRVKALAV